MTSNPMTIPYWPRKTEDHPRFSLVARTKSNHQLENRRILLADMCSRHKEDLSFDRTTMEKQTRSKGIKENSYQKIKERTQGTERNSCGRNERITTSLKATKK